MMMKLIWNPPVWYDLSRDDTLHTCMPEPKQKEFPTIINLSWASPFFACPLFFFGRCHNLAIMLSWNDPFLAWFLDSWWFYRSGERFYYALINACKKRERGEAIKSALLQKTRFFRCIFFEIFWGFAGTLSSLLSTNGFANEAFILYATLSGFLSW